MKYLLFNDKKIRTVNHPDYGLLLCSNDIRTAFKDDHYLERNCVSSCSDTSVTVFVEGKVKAPVNLKTIPYATFLVAVAGKRAKCAKEYIWKITHELVVPTGVSLTRLNNISPNIELIGVSKAGFRKLYINMTKLGYKKSAMKLADDSEFRDFYSKDMYATFLGALQITSRRREQKDYENLHAVCGLLSKVLQENYDIRTPNQEEDDLPWLD